MSKSLERRLDELQLAVMAALEVEGVRIIDDEGEVPLRLTLADMLDNEAEWEASRRAFASVTRWDGVSTL